MTSYSKAFLAAIEQTLAHEGGYVNDPADPGGETKFGISKRSYPDVDIKALTRDAAIAIYHRDFWLPNRCEHLGIMIGARVFDLAVNTGPERAGKILQLAVNAYNGKPILKVDGKIGNLTVSAATLAVPDALLWRIAGVQAGYYLGLVEARPALSRFLNGWLNRAGVV